MKYRMYFGTVKTVVLSLIAAFALAVVILDAVMLSGTSAISTATPAVAGVSLAAGAIILIAAMLLLFNSYYRFDDEGLRIMLGFFRDTLTYDIICGVKQAADTKDVYIVFESEDSPEGVQSICFNVRTRDSKKVLDELRKHCPFVIAETFYPPEKNKKK